MMSNANEKKKQKTKNPSFWIGECQKGEVGE